MTDRSTHQDLPVRLDAEFIASCVRNPGTAAEIIDRVGVGMLDAPYDAVWACMRGLVRTTGEVTTAGLAVMLQDRNIWVSGATGAAAVAELLEVEAGTPGAYLHLIEERHRKRDRDALLLEFKERLENPLDDQATAELLRNAADRLEGQARSAETNIKFEGLDTMTAKPVKWIVPGRIPQGKLVLIAGDGGVGKSTMVRHLIAAITTGRPAFGMHYSPMPAGDVILFAHEDGVEDVVLPSLIAEGADVGRVDRIPYVESGKTGPKSRVHFGLDHLDALKEAIQRRGNVRLVVIDPIASFIGRCRIDDHKQGELRRALDPLNDLAESTGTTVLILAHINKASGGQAVYRIAGSATYTNAVRLAYLVGADPDDSDRRLLMPVKRNFLGVEKAGLAFRLTMLTRSQADAHRRHPAFRLLSDDDFRLVADEMARLEFDGNVLVDADRVMSKSPAETDKSKVEKCCEWLTNFLARYAYPSREIQEAARESGFTFDNLKLAKAELKAQGLRHKKSVGPSGEWWSGFGDPADWVSRPSTTSSPSSPTSTCSPTY